MIASREQLELDLPPVSRWGGRRRGAGRKPGPRPRIPHVRRAPFSKHEPCHVTLRVRRGVPSLRDGRLVHEVERSFRAAAERGSFRVVHYSSSATTCTSSSRRRAPGRWGVG